MTEHCQGSFQQKRSSCRRWHPQSLSATVAHFAALPLRGMDALKALATKLKKEAQEVAGPKKYVKRTQLEEARLQKIREEEAREREEKVRAAWGTAHGSAARVVPQPSASLQRYWLPLQHAAQGQAPAELHAVLHAPPTCRKRYLDALAGPLCLAPTLVVARPLHPVSTHPTPQAQAQHSRTGP